MWGEKLVDELRESGGNKITRRHYDSAKPRVTALKNSIYESRCEEWNDDDLRIPAGILEETRAQRSRGVLTESGLRDAVGRVFKNCGREMVDSNTFTEQIIHTGFLWKPMDGRSLVLGLPSFASYVTEHTRRTP